MRKLLAGWLARKEINELTAELHELRECNKKLAKNLRETREAAKHFDWNIGHANEKVRKFLEIVGLDEYGNPIKER